MLQEMNMTSVYLNINLESSSKQTKVSKENVEQYSNFLIVKNIDY